MGIRLRPLLVQRILQVRSHHALEPSLAAFLVLSRQLAFINDASYFQLRVKGLNTKNLCARFMGSTLVTTSAAHDFCVLGGQRSLEIEHDRLDVMLLKQIEIGRYIRFGKNFWRVIYCCWSRLFQAVFVSSLRWYRSADLNCEKLRSWVKALSLDVCCLQSSHRLVAVRVRPAHRKRKIQSSMVPEIVLHDIVLLRKH
jgi:hypothetical protein